MHLDGYEYRKCGTCDQRYYIHEDATECTSCRGESEESGDEKSDSDASTSPHDGPVADTRRNEDGKPSPAIEMIKQAHSKGDD